MMNTNLVSNLNSKDMENKLYLEDIITDSKKQIKFVQNIKRNVKLGKDFYGISLKECNLMISMYKVWIETSSYVVDCISNNKRENKSYLNSLWNTETTLREAMQHKAMPVLRKGEKGRGHICIMERL